MAKVAPPPSMTHFGSPSGFPGFPHDGPHPPLFAYAYGTPSAPFFSPFHANFQPSPPLPVSQAQKPTPTAYVSPSSSYLSSPRSMPQLDAPIAYDNSVYVALDCEFVGVGLHGMQSALARVSLVSYAGDVLLDTFSAPSQAVSDYRSWVSGVREADLLGAPAFADVQKLVSSALEGKILVGHAVFNDLEVLGIDHPADMTRDTSLYEPLQKLACTHRPSLRGLARIVLAKDIQSGEHSSIEDARVTMAIFKAFQQQWEKSLSFPAPTMTRTASTFAHTAPPSSPEYGRQLHSPALVGDAAPFSPIVNLPNRSVNNPMPPRLQSPPELLPSPYNAHTFTPPNRQASASPGYFPSLAATAHLDPRFSAANAVLPAAGGLSGSSRIVSSPSPRLPQKAERYQIPTRRSTTPPRSYASAISARSEGLAQTPSKVHPPRHSSASPISIKSTERTDRSPSPFSSPSGGEESLPSEDSNSLKSEFDGTTRSVSASHLPLWTSESGQARRLKKRGNRGAKRNTESQP